jgi:hypothetical protein
MRFVLPVALTVAVMTGSAEASAQTLPPWAQWLVTSSHLIEDGRACGLVDPGEVDDLYVAVLMVSATLDGIASDQAAQVLSVARDHARDASATPQICQEAETALPKLRGLLGPMLAAKNTR